MFCDPTTTHLSDEGLSSFIVVLPAICTASHRQRRELGLDKVTFWIVTGKTGGVPVHVDSLTLTVRHTCGAVYQGYGGPACILKAPAASLPDLTDARVTAPMLWGEALEHNPYIDERKRYGDQTENGKNSHLAPTEWPGLL